MYKTADGVYRRLSGNKACVQVTVPWT